MPRLRTLIPIVSAIVIVAILGGYGAWWFTLAGRVENGVARWAAERRAEGWTVKHEPIQRGGFPFSLDLTMPRPELARGDALAWKGEMLTASAKPWAIQDVTLGFPGAHKLALPLDGRARPLDATLGTGRLDLRYDGRGRAEAGALDVKELNARFTDNGEQIAASLVRGVMKRHAGAAPQGSALPVSLETDTRIENLRLPPRLSGLLGTDVALLALLANVIGPMPQATSAAAMAQWRDAGGYLEVKEFQLTYGRLQIQAAGNVRLDAQLQPVVQLDSKVRGADALVDALVVDRQLSFAEGLLGKAGLMALSRQDETGGPPYLRLAITVRDGNRIYLGPVRVGRLPTLQWR
ncbi:MAG: DUF2125 domain-containing protein [Rhodospirillales bacterium]|nr:DUF2125 domain-containing protein [Rhodospirillales bacterium]